MTDFSFIDYEIAGVRHHFTGQWPDEETRAAIGEAFRRMGGDVELVDLIQEIGGVIIQVHSSRADGVIDVSDMENGWVEGPIL